MVRVAHGWRMRARARYLCGVSVITIISRSFVEERIIEQLTRTDARWSRFCSPGYALYAIDDHPEMPGYAVRLTARGSGRCAQFDLQVYDGAVRAGNLVIASGSPRLDAVVRAIDASVPIVIHDDAAIYSLLMAIQTR